VSVLSKLVELNIFASAAKAKPFEEWISRSNIIDLKPLDNDTRVLVVAFILNFFIERLNKNLSVRNGVQPLQMVLFVDEAHNILPKDGKAKLLEKLAREGRSWGSLPFSLEDTLFDGTLVVIRSRDDLRTSRRMTSAALSHRGSHKQRVQFIE